MILTTFERVQDDMKALLEAAQNITLDSEQWEITSGGAGFLGASVKFRTPKGQYTLSLTKIHVSGETLIRASILNGSVDRAETLTSTANFVQTISADPASRAAEMTRVRDRLIRKHGAVFDNAPGPGAGPGTASLPKGLRALWHRAFR